MDIINSIIATIKNLFTEEQWKRITEWLLNLADVFLRSALDVLLVAILVLGTALAFRIVFIHSPNLPNPAKRYVNLVMLLASAAWSFLLLDGTEYDVKAAVSIVAFTTAWCSVTFGDGLLKTYYPRFWAAVGGDRRIADADIPATVKQDRREEPK